MIKRTMLENEPSTRIPCVSIFAASWNVPMDYPGAEWYWSFVYGEGGGTRLPAADREEMA